MPRTTAMALVLVLLLGACSGLGSEPDPSTSISPAPGLLPVAGVKGTVRTTSGDQTGNRVTKGTLDLSADPVMVNTGSEPAWVVGGSVGDDTDVYVVVSVDGSVEAVTVRDDVSTADLEPAVSPAPPTVVFGDGGYRLVDPPDGASRFTAPAVIGDSIVSVTVEGEVSIVHDDARTVIDTEALGDSRLVLDERGLVAVLSDPSTAYPHGVVGDRVESSTVTVFDSGSGEVVGVADAPDGTVFETVTPMWADVDGDGDSELLVTASDASVGARLVVYDESGRMVASSTAIGRGQRWRNLLGVAAFDSDPVVIDVQTPHIGGIVQWFGLDGASLERLAAISEYSTHRIGRRNLDQGVVVDGDGDGRLDVVVPVQSQTALAVLALENGEPLEVASIPLNARISTNLSAFQSADGRAGLAVGLEDGSVLIWR